MFTKDSHPCRHPASITLRPECSYETLSWFDKGLRTLFSFIIWPFYRCLVSPNRFVRKVISKSDQLIELSEIDFKHHLLELRKDLMLHGLTGELQLKAFAAVREAAGRSLGMRHHHTQISASVMIMRGMVAEMATGEGKTLACTLASCTAALAGIKVHVVTTNDYLAKRDCDEMQPLFTYLNVTAASIVNERSLGERQKIYAASIIYSSNNELVFDYLKDSLVLGDRYNPIDLYRDLIDGRNDYAHRLMHQGLVFAIVDEADSVFIDESRTPLVISGGESEMADSEALLQYVMSVAESLVLGEQYSVDFHHRRIILLPEGKLRISQLREENAEQLAWVERIRAEELFLQALSALYLFERDRHYIVADDKVMIVDEYTGRLAPDRSWEGGLHQLIELKEGCTLTKPQKTLAKISYQQFFQKYYFLSGMTGTANEVMRELYSVYGVLVYKVPLLKTSLRKIVSKRVFVSMNEKEQAVTDAVKREIKLGRPVLVGTATVDLSERLSRCFELAHIPFELLTAKQDSGEAEIVALAGQSGRVTVATSMAGRGTDIKLSAAAKAAGGLHVVICELQDASRIDRQLEGRCARQGDPGSVEYILSYEDPLMLVYAGVARKYLGPLLRSSWLRNQFGWCLQCYCQWRLERKHFRERRQTQNGDENERKRLAFLGGGKWR